MSFLHRHLQASGHTAGKPARADDGQVSENFVNLASRRQSFIQKHLYDHVTDYGPSGMKLTCQMSEFALRVNHPFDKNAKGCLHVSLESIAVNFIREKRKEIMVSVISEIGVATVNYDMR